MKKRLLSILLCLTMVTGLLPTAFAAEKDTETVFPYTYNTNNQQTAEKVSHPQVEPNSAKKDHRNPDGVVNYAGNGLLNTNVGTAEAPGCRGESYSWSALGYGDWIYTGLLYNALWSTTQLMGSQLGHQMDPELLPAILDTLYNGDYFMQEEDGESPGGALVKINTKTGEVKILMSSSSEGNAKHDVGFRNAVEYNGKFYFCGTVDKAPQIWQVDPETDECKLVYGMDIKEFGAGFKQGVCGGIRGLCVYKDELIVSSVAIVGKNDDGTPKFGAQIYSTTTPEKKDSYKVIATQEQLFDYPAFHYSDSIYGGSIWEIVEFNDKLYVSICTGTPDNMPDENTMQSFAIVCGEKQDNGTWKWHSVVGDQEHDDAKYTFGIDPERTRSGAGVLTVYKDHLYIGEYNDEEIALIKLMFNFDFGFMNENLEQSVNLYRMDKNEDIELVVGDKTEMFPNGGTSGLQSGFGRNENQYIWRMTVYNDKLYCGTFDTSSLLEPVGQFANGDMKYWTPAQWNKLFNYIRVLLKLTWDKYGAVPITEEEKQTREDISYLFDEIDAFALDRDDPETNGSIDAESDLLAELFSSLPDTCFADDSAAAESAITETLEDTFSDDAATYVRGDNVQDNMGVFPESGSNDNVQDNMQVTPDKLNQMKKLAQSMQKLIQLTKKIIVTAQYMSKADRGCDVYATADGENFETITTDGFGDPFNHGLRVFAETDNGLGFGTANPFYGTQWWLIREDNTKPVEKPAATAIPTSYIVSCTTEGSGHEAKMMNLLPDTFAIGEVKKDDNGYICPITISTEAYAEAYSKEVGKEHSAVKENITFNMTWNGKAWEAPAMTQLPTIDVKCTTSPVEKAPKAPEATEIPTSYIARCVTDKSGHESKMMNLLPDTFAIGEVKKDDNGYICPITISTEAYAEAYSKEVGKEHSAVKENITFNMTWNGKAWEAPAMTQLPTIDVKCTTSTSDGGHSGGGSSHSTKYTLTYVSNGGTSYKNETYSDGTNVTLNKTPSRESYIFTGWYADKELTNKITNIKMTGNKTVYAGWKATSVPDMLNGEDHFAYIVGYPDKTVHPQNGITRAEVATIFFRLLTDEVRDANSTQTNTYSDVSRGNWYNHAVSTLSKMGIVKGDSHGKFNPNAPITRAEFAAIAARFDKNANTSTASFSDIANHWAKDEISASANNGWINGYTDGTFRPNAPITRAEAMALINRVLQRLPESKDDLLDGMIQWSDNADTSKWYYLAVQEATNSHYDDIKSNRHEKWTKLRETRDWTELEK